MFHLKEKWIDFRASNIVIILNLMLNLHAKNENPKIIKSKNPQNSSKNVSFIRNRMCLLLSIMNVIAFGGRGLPVVAIRFSAKSDFVPDPSAFNFFLLLLKIFGWEKFKLIVPSANVSSMWNPFCSIMHIVSQIQNGYTAIFRSALVPFHKR